MASTNSNASAETETQTRHIVLANQFTIAFQKIMNYDAEKTKRFVDKIKQRKISYINFWAYKIENGKRKCWVELFLSVDWKLHDTYLRENKYIVLKKNWGGAIPEITSIIDSFNDLVEMYSLTPTFSVGFSNTVNNFEHSLYMAELGLIKGEKIEYKEGLQTLIQGKTRELPELGYDLKA